MIKNDKDVARLRIPDGKKSVTQPVKTISPSAGLKLRKNQTASGGESLTWFFTHDGKKITVGNSKTDYATACEAFRLLAKRAILGELEPEDTRPRWTLDQLYDQWTRSRGIKEELNQALLWKKHFSPVCGKMIAVDTNYDDVIKIVTDVRDRMIKTGGKVQASALTKGTRAIANMFRWGVKHGIKKTDGDPIAVPQSLKDILDTPQMPSKYQPRQASIDAAAYRELFHRLPDTETGNALRVIMLTGRRKEEVVNMTHAEIRPDVWFIPGTRTKNGKPQSIPLFDDLRAAVGRSTTEAGEVWTIQGSALNGVLRRLGVMASFEDEQTGEPHTVPCTVHDLRRSWANLLRMEVKLDRETVDLMLAHTLSGYDETSRAYQKVKAIHEQDVADGWRRWSEWWSGRSAQSPADR